MKKYIFLSSLSIFLLNCNKKTETTTPVTNSDSLTDTTEKVIDTLGTKSSCYLGVTGKDSVFVSIDDNLGTVTGKMRYKNSEKDSSTGELTGFKSGDTLKLTYEFASEGTTSKRDIFFVQKDGNLLEGIGNQKDDNGQMKYADETKVAYKEDQKLKTTDCAMVLKALK
ncbi:hypothetical protein [Chryseobacterium chendengshani]|uniref:hypothetical protein n=1 Tax=unclassified Chryseobacterium TaxID=2593645 RepID=UPI001C63BB13|nr:MULTISPECIES: hypothetical protein [unclassified Chryseobacterium]MBW7674564.1 hypothetical protein [Chryseobacterium sp. LJ756]MBW8522644.1 hypothetical protein [Chryseobacterium sp. LJ668]QYK16181.1 hypothetical protein K0U91_14130 [Chryseobacterium sp. LJ668]